MLHPAVFNTSEICYSLGVRHVVLSPGSRNAPLILSFARNSKINKMIIPDERSAAFIALGIAQVKKEPVVLCCTSGTALLNYAPAITEAYYRQLPLIALSSDRPPELIDQRDGQTIRQFEVLKNHVKCSVQLPIVSGAIEAECYQEKLIQTIQEAYTLPQGPVHLNVPFTEPFYPQEQDRLTFTEKSFTNKGVHPAKSSLRLTLPGSKKILLLIGQDEPDLLTNQLIDQVAQQIPVIRSPLNNLNSGIEYVDGFINAQETLVPELLITSGLSVLSKKLKRFIRAHKPESHWHFDESSVYVDTFKTKPRLFNQPIKWVLEKLLKHDTDGFFLDQWLSYEHQTKVVLENFMKEGEFSEIKASKLVLERISENSILHLSNSMPVRYADLLGVKRGILTFSNRGTSGIDGCTSTALGTALVSKKMNVLISGDLAFLYDRNAFFHNHQTPNLKIVIMNNKGGGIFRLIEGPANLPELENYFETRHNRTAEYLCKENHFNYLAIHSESEFHEYWKRFIEPASVTTVLEIFTEPEVNQKSYRSLRKQIDEQTCKLEKSNRF
ncbi:MAG: 2-succinyl-5-enolpyruvyl-6-hydroxy-3-cyclohexene-1-carboxylic-acid synthase [Bacteroidota bacterium]